ncbi:MAG: IclR family transcriptional regulator [Subtercola sp.]|nr:IclR family transcriptional regulator [Subtercola sp.]
MTALELSQKTGLERTIVHRLLRSLVANKYVEQAEFSRYELGPRLLRLGNAYLDRLPLRHIALPYVIDISNGLTEDEPWIVGVAVPVEGFSIVVDRLWRPAAPLDSLLDTGTRIPLPDSATGLSLLARYDEATARAICGEEKYESIKGRLEKIRERDYLEFNSELRPGISAIAASIGDRSGRPVGAISVVGLKLEPYLNENSDIAQRVARAAHALTTVVANAG